MSSPKKQPSVLNRVSWVAETQEEPDPLDLVSRAEAGALSLLDLSANRRFAVLDTERRSGLIERIASAAAASSSKLRTVLLNELNLDNSNAPAVATLLRSSRSGSLRAVAVERNQLSEDGMLLLADAVEGSGLSELSLANQRAPIST